MPIAVSCQSCDKKYSVKDEMAGKSFRCKACQASIVVAESVVDDPFAGVDLRSSGKAVEDEDEDESRPSRRSKTKKPKPKRKKARGDGIPVPAMIVLLGQTFLLLMGVYGLFKLYQDQNRIKPEALQSLTGIGVGKLLFTGYVMFFLVNRRRSGRRLSLVFCMLGILTMGYDCLTSKLPLGLDVHLSVATWVVMAICLTTHSAAEWFSE